MHGHDLKVLRDSPYLVQQLKKTGMVPLVPSWLAGVQNAQDMAEMASGVV